MRPKYASAAEEAYHVAAIEALANEMRRPLAEVQHHYERELCRLQEGARVLDYLSVCAARRTRQTLRNANG